MSAIARKGGNKTAKSAANGFANPVPDVDASGITAEEFLAQTFEFEYCEECGKDTEDHTAVIGLMGQWFAYCNKPADY